MSKTIWTTINCSSGFAHSIIRKKIRPKSFLHRNLAFISGNLSFQQPLRCYRTDLIASTVFASIPFYTLILVLWGLSNLLKREKIGQNIFFTGKFAFFFQNFVFSTTSLVLQKCYYNFHSKYQVAFWTPKKCCLRFVTLDIVTKIRPKSFFLRKVAFLFKNIWFQQPLRS